MRRLAQPPDPRLLSVPPAAACRPAPDGRTTGVRLTDPPRWAVRGRYQPHRGAESAQAPHGPAPRRTPVALASGDATGPAAAAAPRAPAPPESRAHARGGAAGERLARAPCGCRRVTVVAERGEGRRGRDVGAGAAGWSKRSAREDVWCHTQLSVTAAGTSVRGIRASKCYCGKGIVFCLYDRPAGPAVTLC